MTQPALPDGFPWPERTREWWRVWADAPQAGKFEPTDWEELLNAALLHAAVWGNYDISEIDRLNAITAKYGSPGGVEAPGTDQLSTLRMLQERVTRELHVTKSARDVAALSLRLMDLVERIAEVEKVAPAAKGTGLDEFTQRRAKSAAAKAPARSARGVKRSG